MTSPKNSLGSFLINKESMKTLKNKLLNKTFGEIYEKIDGVFSEEIFGGIFKEIEQIRH